MFSLFYRWSYDDCVTEASISQDIAPLKFPLKVHNWSHVIISVQAGQEGDVSGGKVSDTVGYWWHTVVGAYVFFTSATVVRLLQNAECFQFHYIRPCTACRFSSDLQTGVYTL
jgi:hypothetical protein